MGKRESLSVFIKANMFLYLPRVALQKVVMVVVVVVATVNGGRDWWWQE